MKDVAPVESRRWAELRLQTVDYQHRIGKAINRIADEELYPFLNEAWRCFRSEAYNSALVWVWCAVSRYLRAMVAKNSWEVVFAFEYERLNEKRPGSMAQVNDREFIESLFRTGIIGLDDGNPLYEWLQSFRERRNALAHGDWSKSDPGLGREATAVEVEATAEDVVEAIEKVVKELLEVPIDERELSLNAATLQDYAMGAFQPIPPDLAQEVVHSVVEPKRLINVCHELLTNYQSGQDLDPEVGMTNVKVVWIAAYRSLEPEDRGSILKQGLKRIAKTLYLDAKQSVSGEWSFAPELKQGEADRVPDYESARAAEDLLLLWHEVSDVLGSTEIDSFNWLREHLRQQISPLARPFKGPT